MTSGVTDRQAALPHQGMEKWWRMVVVRHWSLPASWGDGGVTVRWPGHPPGKIGAASRNCTGVTGLAYRNPAAERWPQLKNEMNRQAGRRRIPAARLACVMCIKNKHRCRSSRSRTRWISRRMFRCLNSAHLIRSLYGYKMGSHTDRSDKRAISPDIIPEGPG